MMNNKSRDHDYVSGSADPPRQQRGICLRSQPRGWGIRNFTAARGGAFAFAYPGATRGHLKRKVLNHGVIVTARGNY